MAELKKCPFCGGEAKFTYSVNGSFMHIHCEDVNCIGSTIMNDYETEAEAIKAWNNRVTEADIRAKAIEEFAEKLKAELLDALRIFSERREMYEIESDMGKMYTHGIGTLKGVNHMIDEIAEQLKGGMGMGECVREKYLDEYIADLDIEPNVKKRMLDLYHNEFERSSKLSECLHHCHKRIDELEQTIVELSVDLATAKRFIREQR